MTRLVFLMSMGFGVLVLAAQQASAAQCADRAMVVATLAERFGETRQAVGLSDDGMMVEVFASSETGSWTITVTRPGGPTCLAAAGQAYQAMAEALPAPGDPA